MRRDLLLLAHRLQIGKREFVRSFDKPADAQLVMGELLRHERIVFGGVRHCAVWPEMRRDILFGQLGCGLPPLGQALDPADHKASSLLNQTRMPDGEW